MDSKGRVETAGGARATRLIRWVTLLSAAAAACAASAAGDPGATPHVKPFKATYEVTYRGLRAGTLTFELGRDASGRYIYETRANPTALARLVVSRAAIERSVMEIDASGVRPLEWTLDDGKSGDKGDGALRFDWSNGFAVGRIEGEDIRLPLEANMQDRLSIQIAVVTALLRGQAPGVYPLIDDNRVKRYEYSKKAPAAVETPLGAVETTIYESTRLGSNRISRFWLAPKFDYAPARAEQIRKGKVETVMTLVSWEASSP